MLTTPPYRLNDIQKDIESEIVLYADESTLLTNDIQKDIESEILIYADDPTLPTNDIQKELESEFFSFPASESEPQPKKNELEAKALVVEKSELLLGNSEQMKKNVERGSNKDIAGKNKIDLEDGLAGGQVQMGFRAYDKVHWTALYGTELHCIAVQCSLFPDILMCTNLKKMATSATSGRGDLCTLGSFGSPNQKKWKV